MKNSILKTAAVTLSGVLVFSSVGLVDFDASAVEGKKKVKTVKASSTKLVNKKLVNKKTGKVLTGFVLFKDRVYKKGVLFAGNLNGFKYVNGRKTNATIKGIKYFEGKKAQGVVNGLFYKSGVKSTGVGKNGKLYVKGKANVGAYYFNKKWYKNVGVDVAKNKAVTDYLAAKKMTKNDYTVASWAVFSKVLAKNQLKVTDQKLTTEKLKTAITALKNAKKSLVLKTTAEAELKAIKEVEAAIKALDKDSTDEQLKAAETLYNKLSKTVKAKVTKSVVTKLNDLKAAKAKLDQAAANYFDHIAVTENAGNLAIKYGSFTEETKTILGGTWYADAKIEFKLGNRTVTKYISEADGNARSLANVQTGAKSYVLNELIESLGLSDLADGIYDVKVTPILVNKGSNEVITETSKVMAGTMKSFNYTMDQTAPNIVEAKYIVDTEEKTADLLTSGIKFTVDQWSKTSEIQLTLSETVSIPTGTKLIVKDREGNVVDADYGVISVVGNVMTIMPKNGEAPKAGTFTISVDLPAGEKIKDMEGNDLVIPALTLVVSPKLTAEEIAMKDYFDHIVVSETTSQIIIDYGGFSELTKTTLGSKWYADAKIQFKVGSEEVTKYLSEADTNERSLANMQWGSKTYSIVELVEAYNLASEAAMIMDIKVTPVLVDATSREPITPVTNVHLGAKKNLTITPLEMATNDYLSNVDVTERDDQVIVTYGPFTNRTKLTLGNSWYADAEITFKLNGVETVRYLSEVKDDERFLANSRTSPENYTIEEIVEGLRLTSVASTISDIKIAPILVNAAPDTKITSDSKMMLGLAKPIEITPSAIAIKNYLSKVNVTEDAGIVTVRYDTFTDVTRAALAEKWYTDAEIKFKKSGTTVTTKYLSEAYGNTRDFAKNQKGTSTYDIKELIGKLSLGNLDDGNYDVEITPILVDTASGAITTESKIHSEKTEKFNYKLDQTSPTITNVEYRVKTLGEAESTAKVKSTSVADGNVYFEVDQDSTTSEIKLTFSENIVLPEGTKLEVRDSDDNVLDGDYGTISVDGKVMTITPKSGGAGIVGAFTVHVVLPSNKKITDVAGNELVIPTLTLNVTAPAGNN